MHEVFAFLSDRFLGAGLSMNNIDEVAYSRLSFLVLLIDYKVGFCCGH